MSGFRDAGYLGENTTVSWKPLRPNINKALKSDLVKSSW